MGTIFVILLIIFFLADIQCLTQEWEIGFSYGYDLSLISYDDDGNIIPVDSEKNNQPMFMNNWFGGEKDHRTFVTGLDGKKSLLVPNNLMYLFNTMPGAENVFRNRQVDISNHVFDYFGYDAGGLLKRTNFCPNPCISPEN